MLRRGLEEKKSKLSYQNIENGGKESVLKKPREKVMEKKNA